MNVFDANGNSHIANEAKVLPAFWLESGIVIIDSEGVIKSANEGFANWLGVSVDKLVGSKLSDILSEFCDRVKNALPDLKGFSDDFFYLSTECDTRGGKGWVNIEGARSNGVWFLRFGSTFPPVAAMDDEYIDEQLRKDSQYRELFVRMIRAEARLHNLMTYWPGVIFTQRADSTFSFISPKIEEFTGLPQKQWYTRGSCFWDSIHEGDLELVKQVLKRSAEQQTGITTTYRIRHSKSGKVFYVLEHRQSVKTESGVLLGYEGVWLDVTRQTIAEKRLSTASWKEALGVLTMGLAHDFSNVMSGIHGLSESFAAHLGPDHPFREGLELIKSNSLQASQIVHRIINLHHGKIGERAYYDLNQLVNELTDLIKKVVPRRLQLEVNLAKEQLPVYVDPVELRQVVINMTLNAVDAMPRQGTITFQTTLLQQPPEADLIIGSLSKTTAVCLSIKDTGCGIKKKHLPMIFDPFFTTKPMNKGSGLGLYNAKVFIEKHNGLIAVKTKEGQGTTFSILLPMSDFTEAERESSANGRRKTLLLVGTSEQTLEQTAELLRIKGFVVVICDSFEKIVDMLNSEENIFSGVILISENNQQEVGEAIGAIHKLRKPLKIIVQVTGCNQDEIASDILMRSDLTIYPDMSESEIIEKLRALFSKEDLEL